MEFDEWVLDLERNVFLQLTNSFQSKLVIVGDQIGPPWQDEGIDPLVLSFYTIDVRTLCLFTSTSLPTHSNCHFLISLLLLHKDGKVSGQKTWFGREGPRFSILRQFRDVHPLIYVETRNKFLFVLLLCGDKYVNHLCTILIVRSTIVFSSTRTFTLEVWVVFLRTGTHNGSLEHVIR